MKPKFLTFATLAVALFAGTLNVSAVTPPTTEGATPESGKVYYLYNIGAGAYMNHGSSWGTHVTVDGAGCELTLGGSDGAYTIHHAGIDASKYQTEDGWSDNTTAGKFSFEAAEADGYTNVYYLKCSGGNYYYWAGGVGQYGDEAVVASALGTTNAYKWILIPAADREALTAGNDVTYKLKNPDFAGKADALDNWSGDFVYQTSTQTNITGIFAEKWAGTYSTSTGTVVGNNYHLNDYSIYQSLTVPAGKYTLSSQAWAVQQGDAEDVTGAYLFAGETTTSLGANNNYSVNFISDGSALNIGVKTVSTTCNWIVCDKFRLTMVEPAVSTCATTSTSPVTAAVDTWYAISVPVAGTYTLTTTDDATVLYTQTGTDLGSEVTASASTGTELALAAGTLYVKASAASTVTLAAKSYSYELGDATLSTANGAYTQSATYTVTYPSQGTNDPDATAALVADSKATVNGAEVALAATTNGFTVDLGTLAASTAYTIVIPAGVYGYSDKAMNEAINVTINTPAVFDGTYFVKAADGRYISRGNNYNTCAIVDNYGVAVKVATSAANITTFTFVDNNKQLFDANNGTVYTDNTTYPNWSVAKVDGGFNIINQNDRGTKGNALWIEENTDTNYKYDRIVAKADGTAEVFTFEATADHPAAMTANKKAVINGLDEIAKKLPSSEVTITTPVASGAELYQAQGDITETLSNIPNGLYKVSVYAYQRLIGTAATWTAHEAGYDAPTTTLYANDKEINICGLFDQTTTSATARYDNSSWASDVLYGGNYYPNSTAGGDAAIADGNYLNEIYVVVTDNTLKFGLYKGNKIGNGDWVYYKNFAVTYYGETRATATDKFGTLCVPYVPTVTGATLYSAEVKSSGDTQWVSLTEVTTPEAGTPYIYKATADAQTFAYTSGALVSAPVAAAPLTGVFKATAVPANSYVMQTSSDKTTQTFNKVAEDNTIELPAYKAYLTVSSPAKSLSIGFDDEETTGIDAINALVNGTAKIYDLNGRQLNSLQKGVNIVNGVKVMVK